MVGESEVMGTLNSWLQEAQTATAGVGTEPFRKFKIALWHKTKFCPNPLHFSVMETVSAFRLLIPEATPELQ